MKPGLTHIVSHSSCGRGRGEKRKKKKGKKKNPPIQVVLALMQSGYPTHLGSHVPGTCNMFCNTLFTDE